MKIDFESPFPVVVFFFGVPNVKLRGATVGQNGLPPEVRHATLLQTCLTEVNRPPIITSVRVSVAFGLTYNGIQLPLPLGKTIDLN